MNANRKKLIRIRNNKCIKVCNLKIEIINQINLIIVPLIIISITIKMSSRSKKVIIHLNIAVI